MNMSIGIDVSPIKTQRIAGNSLEIATPSNVSDNVMALKKY